MKLLKKWVILKRLPIKVPGGGLEPPRPNGHRILSPERLPIPPSGHIGSANIIIIFKKAKIFLKKYATFDIKRRFIQ